VILEGKIIPSDRCKEPALCVKGELIDLWYSGKAHAHGGNIQAVLAPDRCHRQPRQDRRHRRAGQAKAEATA